VGDMRGDMGCHGMPWDAMGCHGMATMRSAMGMHGDACAWARSDDCSMLTVSWRGSLGYIMHAHGTKMVNEAPCIPLGSM
jgi:hypothetical protein